MYTKRQGWVMAGVLPADFHTSKTPKDMNSDSFTLLPSALTIGFCGSTMAPVTLLPLTMIRWPLPCHLDMLYIHHCRLSAWRDLRKSSIKADPRAESSCGQTTYHLCKTFFLSSIKHLNGFKLSPYNNTAMTSLLKLFDLSYGYCQNHCGCSDE